MTQPHFELINQLDTTLKIVSTHYFYIPIKPEPKQSATHGGGKTWISPAKKLYVDNLVFGIKTQYKGEPLNGPLKLTVVYAFKTGKTCVVNERVRFMGIPWYFYMPRPDLDNLTKPLQDALMSQVCTDDSNIVDLRARKIYWHENGIIFKVEKIMAVDETQFS